MALWTWHGSHAETSCHHQKTDRRRFLVKCRLGLRVNADRWLGNRVSPNIVASSFQTEACWG
eukprot:5740943-Amphidinium_carterae.1